MSRRATVIVIVALAVLVVGSMSVYTIRETETAIKFRLGEIVATDIEPGLHFKFPLVNNVRTFDARVHTLDLEPQRFLTVEKKNVIVDAFVKWRIGDVRTYYTTVGGDPLRANLRLAEIIKEGLRNEFGTRTIDEVVTEDREEIMQALTQRAAEAGESLGIEVLDLRIRRIDLPEAVSESVFRRMAAEREAVAREFRAEGAEEAERVRAAADRTRQIILAEARSDAETIRGEGDAQAAETYATAYSKHPEFYSFYRSLIAYREAFEGGGDVLVLSPESQFFRYFERAAGAEGGSEDSR